MTLKEIQIYEFTDLPGGEHYWLQQISEKLGASLIRFWDRQDNRPNLKSRGIFNFAIYIITKVALVLSPKIARGIYSLFGIYTYKIESTCKINIISSTFIPLPRSRGLIAYVHTPSRLLSIYSGRELRSRDGKIISMLYFRVWKAIYYFLYKSSFSRAGLVITNSINTQNRLKKYFGIDSVVVYPSQNVKQFQNKRYDKYFFYPSRISPPKRQLFVLRAFAEFYRQNREFRLILASTSPNTDENRRYVEEVRKFIADHDLPVEIKLDLARSEILDAYSHAYLCLFAGEDEDFGLIPVESMASYKPIISVKEGGPMETIKDGITGYLVSDEHEMAERMLELSGNLPRVKEMGLRGREHVERTFSDEKFVSDLLNLINTVGR